MKKFIVTIETSPNGCIERTYMATNYIDAIEQSWKYIKELQKINNIDPHICMYPNVYRVYDTNKERVIWDCYNGEYE